MNRLLAFCAFAAAVAHAAVFDVTAYGAKGDGKTQNRDAINKTIEAAAAAGGEGLPNVGLRGSGHYGNASAGFVDNNLDEPPPLLNREPREFSRRAVRIESVYAAVDQPRDKASQLGFIDLSVVIDGRQ